MALDFPASPTTGQTFTSGNNIWTYNGSGWTSAYQSSGFVRQSFTAGAGQTSFTVIGGYLAGLIDVYQNGVKLVNGTDVTVTSGSTITLATGATLNDIVEVIGLSAFSGAGYLPLAGGSLTGGLTGTTGTFSGALSGATVADAVATIRPLVTGTLQNTTTGSAFDFTGIPSWVKRITVMMNGISNVSGVGAPLVQLGSGSIDTASYNSASTYSVGTNNVGSTAATNGMLAGSVLTATTVYNGVLVLTHMGSNIWLSHGTGDATGLSGCYVMSGTKTLSGVLDRIRFTQHVADTFDAGSVNIMYE